MKTKRDKLERRLLMAESGELSCLKRRRLQKALAEDPSLQGRQKEWAAIRQALHSEELTPLADDRRQLILDEARRIHRHRVVSLYPLFLRPAAVVSVLLLLVLGMLIAVGLHQTTPDRHPESYSAVYVYDDYWFEDLDRELVLLTEEIRQFHSDLHAQNNVKIEDLASELFFLEQLEI